MSVAVIDPREDLSRKLLNQAYEALTPVQKSVIDLVASETPTAEHPAICADDRTFWQRLADRVAAVGGSWGFIFGFFAMLVLWIGWNVATQGFGLSFDIYPFIFLNLMLSMLAAIQAPVIMMSQNRAAAKDRQAAEHDYVVNLRAELEILHLHDKLDALREQELVNLIKGQNETLELLKAQMKDLSAKVAKK
ncbi:MAG: hypothetical protein JWP35_1799 [Caulobacter sp.]|nr:hypothetical protein [Caulobacter sp.]